MNETSKPEEREVPSINPEDETKIRELIPAWHAELQKLLPKISNEIKVEISNKNIIPGLGVGGRALREDTIELDFDSSFKDREEQMVSIKGTYFHEAFHIAQGFHFENLKRISPTENAINEGLATRFEGIVVGSKTPYGDYSEISDIESWVSELGKISYEEFMENWSKYKFYDPNTRRRWWFYRAGAYLVDKYRETNPNLSWAELAETSPDLIWDNFANITKSS